ncbi:hypothetical protein F0P96_19775 [Hymenobacter busanensis]|uniref:Uncharacterized protein n=1 Tax=Hymenobacter busanensis TaxID=2607656 RepID=A0A7L5A2X1_9BACT|nr:hypothetical protein F0P96_19775 [Hymenobacter busanensis]QHJ09677.1 hypothetical protein GUY19_10890 [Hymenobacter busanensis]
MMYGLLYRIIFGSKWLNQAGGVLLLAFLVVVPIGLGALTALLTPREAGKAQCIWVLPWTTVGIFLVTAAILGFEGAICLLIIFPLFLGLANLGAWIYTLGESKEKPPRNAAVVAALGVLPLLVVPIESRFVMPTSLRRVENTVDVAATPDVVWQHIIRVPPIEAADLGPSLVDDIGFPRPVEATLSHEGVGGVRHATFERGVEFIETVDVWKPRRKLSFRITPNTATIPPTTFDEHVTVGGRFFDVLRGTYELRPLPGGRTRLVLYSEQRLSTNLNPYAGLWTDYVMSEIQRRILQVVKRRCEVQAVVQQ